MLPDLRPPHPHREEEQPNYGASTRGKNSRPQAACPLPQLVGVPAFIVPKSAR